MKHKKLLLVAIILLGIGFATVATTLYINGNVKIATNNANFDVKFTKAVLDGTDISTTAISEDGKTIEYGTKDLSTVGEISKLDFKVTNNSEMYDAEVSVACSTTGAKKNYYEITSSVKSPILGKTTEKGNVQVKLLKASVDDIYENFICTLTATAAERTTKAEAPKIYYAFGTPTTSSTQDYTTLTYPSGSKAGQQAKVFVKLEGNQKSVCIVRNGNLECFENNNVAEEQKHVREVFSDITCRSDGSYVGCYAGDFYCVVNSVGTVRCSDNAANLLCDVGPEGSVYCN